MLGENTACCEEITRLQLLKRLAPGLFSSRRVSRHVDSVAAGVSRACEVNGGSLALFALDAAWVAALCLIQSARSRLPDAIEPAVQKGRQET
jgi:hypothetical protein